LLHIGMVFGIGEDPRDHPTLVGDAEAAFIAKGFEVDLARHGADVEALRRSIKSDRLAISGLLARLPAKNAAPVRSLPGRRKRTGTAIELPGLAALRAQANLLGERAALLRIVWRDHWILGREVPLGAVLFRRHLIMGHQVALQHLEFL